MKPTIVFAFTMTIIIALSTNSTADTEVSGPISGLWRVEDSPFVVVDDVYVPSQRRLTIAPGVDVRFEGDFTFYVYGAILARGTAEDSIRFFGGDEGWGGIRIIDPFAPVRLEYCAIMGGRALRSDNYEDTLNSGGNLFVYRGDLTLGNCLIAAGEAHGYGGGVGVWGGRASVRQCLFVNNNSDTQGGAANVRWQAAAWFADCAFIDNIAGWGGAGVNIEDRAEVIIHRCLFQGGRAATGGGVSLYGRALRCSQSKFVGNHASMGGGAYVRNEDNTATFEWCDFIGNAADLGEGVGGGIHFRNQILAEARYCRFIGNYATWSGGGIFISEPPRLTLEHLLFLRNNVGSSGGAVGLSQNLGERQVNMDHCTFLENTALGQEAHAGVAQVPGHSRLNIFSSIVWGPEPHFVNANNVTVTNSHIQRGFPGAGNVDENPMIFEMDSTWALLRGDSPCVNSGDPNLPDDRDQTRNDRGWMYFPTDVWDGLASDTIAVDLTTADRVEAPLEFRNLTGAPIFVTPMDNWREGYRDIIMNVSRIVNDLEINAAAWANGNYFLTGGNSGRDPNRVYRLDRNFNLIDSFDQPGGEDGDGFIGLATDGNTTLYGGDEEQVVEFDVAGELGERWVGPIRLQNYFGLGVDVNNPYEDLDIYIGDSEGMIVRTDLDLFEQDRFNVGRAVLGLGVKENTRAIYFITEPGPRFYLMSMLFPDDGRVIPLHPFLPPADHRMGDFEVTQDYVDGRGMIVGVWKGEGNTGDLVFASELYTSWLVITPEPRLLMPGEAAAWSVVFAGDQMPAGDYDSQFYLVVNGYGEDGVIPARMHSTPSSAPIGANLPSKSAIAATLFPNPFNAVTRLSYSLPQSGWHRVSLVDAQGRSLALIADGYRKAGDYHSSFDGSLLSSGRYFVRIISEESSVIKPVSLVK